MPQRTNDFQKLVSMVQRALAPAGAKITDSKLIDVPGIEDSREIDVLIETDVGPYRIKIAVEARKQNRKLDSSQFESIVGKYKLEGGVKVDKIVIVTYRGFYDPVIKRARQLGVELLTLKQAQKAAWRKLRPEVETFATAPHICDVEVIPVIPDFLPEDVLWDSEIVCSHGKRFGNPTQFAAALFLRGLSENRDMLQATATAAIGKAGGQKCYAKVNVSHPHVVQMRGLEFPLNAVRFGVHFSEENAEKGLIDEELRFRTPPHVCRIRTFPPIENHTSAELLNNGHVVCACCGRDHGGLRKYVDDGFRKMKEDNPEILRELEASASSSPNGSAWKTATWQLRGQSEQGRIHTDYAIRMGDGDHRVEKIFLEIHAVNGRSPIVRTTYEYQTADGKTTTLTHMQAEARGKRFSILIPQRESGHVERMVLNVESSPA